MTQVTSKAGSTSALKQTVRGIISSSIDTYFKSTLGTEPGIVDYVMGLVQMESSFRPGITGPMVSEVATPKQKVPSSRARQYIESGPVQAILATGSAEQKRNLQSGKVAQGLMQVMGWNIVRGGSSKTKRCEVEESKQTAIAQRILVNAGESIESRLLGEANMENNILAGLLILEQKYLSARRSSTGWYVGKATFSSRVRAAVGAYLGVAANDLVTRVSAEEYVASIVEGESFRVANGKEPGRGDIVVRTAQSTSTGPTTNGSSVPASIPGCA